MTQSSFLTTTQAARALGVSISTIKRWVDIGVLTAKLTAGGHRKLLASDVRRMAGGTSAAVGPTVSDLRRVAQPGGEPVGWEAFADALESGDAQMLRQLGNSLREQGGSVAQLVDDFLAPALCRIGRRWQAGDLDIYQEHRASQLCLAFLYEIKSRLDAMPAAGRNQPLGLVACPAEVESTLAPLGLQLVMAEAGWNAVNLGPNLPWPSLQRAVVEQRPALVCLSLTHLPSEKDFLAGLRSLVSAADQLGVAIAMGGNGLSEAVRAAAPDAFFGKSFADMALYLNSMHPAPGRPKRGRPPRSPASSMAVVGQALGKAVN